MSYFLYWEFDETTRFGPLQRVGKARFTGHFLEPGWIQTIDATLHLKRRADAGIATLRLAAEAEDALPYAFGPPRVFKPTFELLGEELLRLGRRDESEAAYRRANERNPGRTLSVRGLA